MMEKLISEEEETFLLLLFKQFNVSSTEELTFEEAARLFHHLYPKLAGWEIANLIFIVDTDHNEVIDFTEFLQVR